MGTQYYSSNTSQEEKKEDKKFFCEDLEEVIKRKDEEIARLHDMLNMQKTFEIPSLKNNEFEFKYLVKSSYYDEIKSQAHASVTRTQGYFTIIPSFNCNFSEIRVSKRSDRDYGLITMKTSRVLCYRLEYHSRMDGQLALELIHQLPHVSKQRYYLTHEGCNWVVDFFLKENAGLVMAEVEFGSEEEMKEFQEKKVYPKWVDLDVTDDDRFYNCRLATNPWPTWPENREGGKHSWWQKRFQQIWL